VFALVVAGVVLLAALVLSRLAPPAPLRPPERGAVFSNVTVVNPGAGREAGRTVRVEGGRIASIGPAVADQPGRAEADGGYLLPGLVDMHVHGADTSIDGQQALFSLLYLAHGVTALRNTGGGEEELAQRERIARGEDAGPRIFACGPLHDGKPPIWAFSTVVETPEQAEKAVAYVAEAGFDCVKVYERLLPEAQAALVRGAHERGLPVVGHVPDRVRFEDAGIDDIQHLRGIERADGREPILDLRRVRRRHQDWAGLSAERIDHVARTSLAKGIAYTPTLVLLERGSRMDRLDEQMADPVMRLLPRFYSALSWNPRGFPWYAQVEASDWELARAARRNASRMVAALFRAGVRIHAGTDVGNPFLVPGASLHEELHQLVAAGLTPEEAWLTATRWPGEFLHQPGLGTVAPGAPADLLLFREDPTRDLEALATLEAVVADGRLYSREALDEALEASQRVYRGWLYDTVSMAIGTRRRDAALAEAREQ
jgi:cytosine/adenosine deaminase-related metal-dependent hydrolase